VFHFCRNYEQALISGITILQFSGSSSDGTQRGKSVDPELLKLFSAFSVPLRLPVRCTQTGENLFWLWLCYLSKSTADLKIIVVQTKKQGKINKKNKKTEIFKKNILTIFTNTVYYRFF
jgi:hypothetical protein